ncbi:class I SAM-dependent methyltransferase [Streptomyces sp. NPDC054796]
MNALTEYADAWDGFWRDAPPGEGAVLWDAAPEEVAALHLPLLLSHTPGTLPLVDVGCGNGTQTRFLARHYARVIGVDLSGTAVERARGETEGTGEGTSQGTAVSRGTVEFRRLDAADPAQVGKLGEELGDADVYLRGVLHQCGPDDRARIAASVATLVGRHGRALVVEPARAAKDVLLRLMRREEGPPPALAAVFSHGIAPVGMDDGSVPGLFRAGGLRVFASGSLPLVLTVPGADGSPVALPANWLVVGRNG